MSYLVLARKSRPQCFAEVIGQRAAVRTLQNALVQNRVPHAILFSGVRGTGKTTLARIMAKALNCTDRQGPEPCNQCLSCQEINAGASVDLQEVDGASNRGIQEIRELKERIRFQPSSSRYKIFIIDEVHMLTTEAFNALLKTLEEPPEHVYFMFATTELHKLPLTILSRCQRYELKRLSRQELHNHFAALAHKEEVSISAAALDIVAREAAGSVRDGLSLLDQLFSYCGQSVDQEDVLDVLGLVSRESVANLGIALLRADLASALELVDALHIQGADVKRLGNDLLQWLRELLLCKLGPKTAAMLMLPEDELIAMQELAAPYNQEQLAALFNLLMDALEQSVHSREPRLALEMACIRAVQVADITPTAELIERFNSLLGDTPLVAQTPPVQTPAPPARPAPLAVEKKNLPKMPPEQSAEPASKPLPPGEQGHDAAGTDSNATINTTGSLRPPQTADSAAGGAQAPSLQRTKKVESTAKQTANKQSRATSSPPAARESVQLRVQRDWDRFVHHVQEQLRWMGLALQQALSVRVETDKLIVLFRSSDDCHMLTQQDNLRKLTDFALDFFQESLQVCIEEELSRSCEVNPLTGRTPLEERNALASDPMVQTALEVFSGQLGDIRIGTRYKEAVMEQDEEDLARLPAEDDD